MRLVLDASVVVAAVRHVEPSFAAARATVNRALRGDDELVVPTLLAVEVAASLARVGEPAPKIRELVAHLTSSPHQSVPLGPGRAKRAMELAIAGKLRGADAVYVWLASSRRIALCTLDAAMAERAAAFCKVIGP
jgi:predicted nucleic acid-binding protein